MIKKIIPTIIILLGSAAPALAVNLINPLGEGATTDPRLIIGRIISAILGIIGSISLVIFIYGGWEIMSSMGDSGKIHKGRDTMIYAAIGLIVIFASYAIASYVVNTISGAGTQ